MTSAREWATELLWRSVERFDDPDPEPASPQQVSALQEALGFPLPQDLRDWLSVCNGSRLGRGGLYGCRPAEPFIDIVYQDRYGWAARKWIPVAGDGCGNTYVLDAAQGGAKPPVYFIDHGVDTATADYVVASGLWEFMAFNLEDELFDEMSQGYWPFHKERVLEKDPTLAAYSGSVPLAWDADGGREGDPNFDCDWEP